MGSMAAQRSTLLHTVMEKKCPKCDQMMKMVCTDDHEHGQTCEMKCDGCGHSEPMGGAQDSSEGSSGEAPAAM